MVAFFVPPPSGVPQVLTQKGYGKAVVSGSGALTINYDTVTSGSAPAVGDLVVAIAIGYDSTTSPMQNIAGSGWAQNTSFSVPVGVSMVAKTLADVDISAPPTIVSGPTGGACLLWAAYSIGGLPAIASGGLSFDYAGNSAPTTVSRDSSALNPPDAAITIGMATGNDSSIQLSLSGVTAQIDQVIAIDFIQVRLFVSLDVGGVSAAASKGDDGSINSIAVGYISAQW